MFILYIALILHMTEKPMVEHQFDQNILVCITTEDAIQSFQYQIDISRKLIISWKEFHP